MDKQSEEKYLLARQSPNAMRAAAGATGA